MSPVAALALHGNACFPRVSGDEPSVIMTGIARALFSPRERG